nr:MAG TPA: hemolysin [Caudoviricetes sp.]
MDDKPLNKWQVKEIIDDAITKHELRKENDFVRVYVLDLYKKDIESRLKDLETDAAEAKDRNKWLFRLVVGAVITSFVPIVIALLSNSRGGLLR